VACSRTPDFCLLGCGVVRFLGDLLAGRNKDGKDAQKDDEKGFSPHEKAKIQTLFMAFGSEKWP